MNRKVLVLTSDEELLKKVTLALGDLYLCQQIESSASVADEPSSDSARAVFVHLCPQVLGDSSPRRFLSELQDSIKQAPLIGLVAEDCPSQLRRLVEGTLDSLVPASFEGPELLALLQRLPDLDADLEEFWRGTPHRELHGQTRSFVTFTPSLFPLIDDLQVAARHDVTALLIGETGSGKTFTARLIHELSDRRDERFCTVACGALPPDLIESELFGYVKGAFTGADRDKEGKFAAAGSGTLLLDEIDVLPPEQQAKLLRVIETGEYEPVGSNETQHSKARLIVASNMELEELVRTGTFRTDLYYRLNILNLRLMPLRNRPWDIEYLARKFALEHSRSHGIRLRDIEPAFLDALQLYDWPGNVREMENVVRRAVLYSQRGVLGVRDLPSNLRAVLDQRLAKEPTVVEDVRPVESTGVDVLNPLGTGGLQPATTFGDGIDLSLSAATNATTLSSEVRTLEAHLDGFERLVIADSLSRNRHSRKDTAAELGISRVTLYNKMKKFGLLG